MYHWKFGDAKKRGKKLSDKDVKRMRTLMDEELRKEQDGDG